MNKLELHEEDDFSEFFAASAQNYSEEHRLWFHLDQDSRQDAIARSRTRTSSRIGPNGVANPYSNASSGGIRQRIGPARALVSNRGISLKNAVIDALDLLIRHPMQGGARKMQRELRFDIAFMTHNNDQTMRFGTKTTIPQE
ncbi:UNVERIFIED_ORG: ABC-type proline/glycine betaine transport system ATPase subunit [Paraburkholderia sediminicola]|nr:ABC-type proline/glycine betaine transport system ATPase subunit [Paraburkholderia sediminicola]